MIGVELGETGVENEPPEERALTPPFLFEGAW